MNVKCFFITLMAISSILFGCMNRQCTDRELAVFAMVVQQIKNAQTPSQVDDACDRLYAEFLTIEGSGNCKISKDTILKLFGKSMVTTKDPLTYFCFADGYSSGRVVMFYIDFWGNVSKMETGSVIN